MLIGPGDEAKQKKAALDMATLKEKTELMKANALKKKEKWD